MTQVANKWHCPQHLWISVLGESGGAGVREINTRLKGRKRGKVSTTRCHRQTDDSSTRLHAGDLAVITPQTYLPASTHAHTYTHVAPTYCTARIVSGSYILSPFPSVFIEAFYIQNETARYHF